MRKDSLRSGLIVTCCVLFVGVGCRNGREHFAVDGSIPGEGGGEDGSAVADAPSVDASLQGLGDAPSGVNDMGFLPSDGQTDGKFGTGTRCTSSGDCLSGFCVDGVCCESQCSGQCEACGERGTEGKCVAVQGTPRPSRAACGGQLPACAARCDGSNRTSCSFPGPEQECGAAACSNGVAVTRSVCDRNGGCPAQTMVTCAPSACDGTICGNGCSAQRPCTSDSFCAAGKCFPKKDLGATCAQTEDCKSGQCVDGVCCESSCAGACQTCADSGSLGHCTTVRSADDDHCPGKTCDTAGACKSRPGDVCTRGEDCTTGSCVDGRCCVTGSCGQCRACLGGGGTCVVVAGADDTDSCVGTCDASGVCKSKRGQPCGSGCASGSSCSADGYCCDQACTNPCMACDLPGSVGTCTAVPSGNPHGGGKSCGSGTCAGTCSGRPDGQCSYPSPPPTCGSGPTCAGNTFTGQSTCSNGSCTAPASQNCPNGCSSTGCKAPCVTTPDCDYPQVCSAGNCVKVTQIACGYYFTCALLGDGTVRCWGENMFGQLGTGMTSDHSASPAKVTGVSGAKALSAGYRQACVLQADGSAMCWGSNVGGAIGLDPATTMMSATPVAIPGLTGASALASAGTSLGTCAFIPGGSIKCWGANGSGQLGNGMMSAGSSTAVPVNGITNATTVFAGGQTEYALLPGGTVKGWGNNAYGQLATDSPTQTSNPIDVAVGASGVTNLAASGGHACAVLGDGSVRCFGSNDSGQLGNGMMGTGGGTPVTVQGLPAAKAVSAYPSATCALLTDGTVRCWGSAPLGEGSSMSLSPVTVTGLSNVTSICTGGAHSCVLLSNGQVRCWGYNQKGQLGDGSTGFRATPVAVAGW